MRSEILSIYFTLLHFAHAVFPEDPKPISIVPDEYTKLYPVFVGNEPGDSATERDKLDIQVLTIIGRTLYAGARDHVYSVDLDQANKEGVFLKHKMFWEAKQNERDSCLMKGKSEGECHNFIKVLLKRNDDTLLICGTHAFNPICRDYTMDSLEHQGEEMKGRGRCPHNPKDGNVALFSDGNLYTATTSDFIGIDAVIYRSLGESPFLRTIKQDSKWLKEPFFVHAVERGGYIYFFFRETAVEFSSIEKVVLSRVARVCKNDQGGNVAVLDKEWTSFVKARLDCSVPGDPPFHFNKLHSVTDVINIDGMDIVLATFSTPLNSIPGSAVCAYDLAHIDDIFAGEFKEQLSPLSLWTPVPGDQVSTPRPGSCAGSASLEAYASSSDFPDDALKFIKTHSLMNGAVESTVHQPWFQQTVVRDRLVKITADTSAGPSQDYTVVFIGSETGKIMKFLALTEKSHFLDGSLFLEEMTIYNSEKCSYNGEDDRRIIAMQLDKQHGALYVAFSSCIIRAPLGNCDRHGACKKACIASQDPYCGWVNEGCVQLLPGTTVEFEQDILKGNTEGLDEC